MKNKKNKKKSLGRCVSASRRAAECGSARFRSMGPRCSLRGRWSAFSFSPLHFRYLFIFLPFAICCYWEIIATANTKGTKTIYVLPS